MKKTLLLVEDDMLISMNEKFILENYNYKVIIAETGKKAIDIIKTNNDIDLILMDIDLGDGIDGTETAKIILEILDIPIVFLSSHSEPEIVEKTEKITSYGYVLKNSSITVIDASIKMAFKLFNAKQELLKKDILLMEREKIVNQMLNAVPDMISIHDTDMNIIYSNWQGFATIPKEKQIFNTKCYKTYRDFDSICPDCLAKDVIKTKKPFKDEAKLIDGSWVELSVIPFLNKNGDVEMFMEWVSDITSRKKTEENLKKNQQKFKSYLLHSPTPTFLTDLKGNYIFANPAASKLTGFSIEELLEMNVSILLHPDNKDNSTFEKVLQGEIVSEEISLLSKENKKIYVILNAVKLDDSNVIGYCVDVTERRQSEETIKNQNKLLVQSNKEKEVLMGEIHHRVKNNLQIIQSLINMQKHYIAEDSATVSILDECINRIRSMSLIHENLYQNNNFTEINMNNYIAEQLKNLMSVYHNTNCDISLNIDVEEIHFNIDKAVFTGLLLNEIVSNSLKHAFIDKQNGIISISLVEKKKKINTKEYSYELIVRDDGVGFEKSPDSFKNDTNDFKTYGLYLINLLIRQLSAALIVKRNKGTEYIINF